MCVCGLIQLTDRAIGITRPHLVQGAWARPLGPLRSDVGRRGPRKWPKTCLIATLFSYLGTVAAVKCVKIDDSFPDFEGSLNARAGSTRNMSLMAPVMTGYLRIRLDRRPHGWRKATIVVLEGQYIASLADSLDDFAPAPFAWVRL